MSISPFNEKDYALIEAEYAGLKEASARRCASKEELDVVQKAFEFANEAHKNVRRRSGEPYILHPIAVAKIVVSTIGLGYKFKIPIGKKKYLFDVNYALTYESEAGLWNPLSFGLRGYIP